MKGGKEREGKLEPEWDVWSNTKCGLFSKARTYSPKGTGTKRVKVFSRFTGRLSA